MKLSRKKIQSSQSERVALIQPANLTEPDLVYKNGKKLLGRERESAYDLIAVNNSFGHTNYKKSPLYKKKDEYFLMATTTGKDEVGRTMSFLYNRKGKPQSYKELYRDFLKDTEEMIKEGGGEKISKESQKLIKDAIRKQAKKDNLKKSGKIALITAGSAGLAYGGYKAYKHHKDKKKGEK